MAADQQGRHSHDWAFAAKRMLQHTPDTFQTTTIPNPHPHSGGPLRSTEPPRLSQLGNEWTLEGQDEPYYAGSRLGPSGNSTFSPYPVFTPGRGVPISSVRSAGASPVMLQRHGISHCTLPEGNLGLVSQQLPWSSLAGQPAPALGKCTEGPASTNGLIGTWQSPETRHPSKRHTPSSSVRLRKPQWRLTATNGTAFPSANYYINGCHGITCNNSGSLEADLEIHEQNRQAQTTAPFTSPASIFSTNSADSGYISALDVPVCPCSSNTSTSNAATSSLTEDTLLEFCDMPYLMPGLTRTQLDCDEMTISSDAYLGNGLKDGIGFGEGRVPTTMNKVPSHWPLSKWQETEDGWERLLVVGIQGRSADLPACSSNVSADPSTGANTPRCSETLPRPSTPIVEPGGSPSNRETTCVGDEYEDINADGDSRAPTPWPERWYEGGSSLGLRQFAAEVMADCQGYHGDDEGTNDEIGTAQCPTDNDAGHHGQEDTGSTRTTGESSTSSQTTHPGGQSFAGHPTKRPRSSDDGDNDEDRLPKRRDAKSPPDGGAGPNKFYACQYHKRYPQQSPFCGMPHGSKRGFGWNSVSRVKQHLLESHGLDHHCRNCWKAYKKVQDAENCHEIRKCLQRPSPPKHWLSETQIAQLKAERVTSQSGEAWYRIADILFDNEQDYSPESFRAQHTPYYDKVNHRKPFSEDPSPYRSPDSMWTPISDSTNPPGSTPMPGNQNGARATEPGEEGAPALVTDPLPCRQAQEYYNQPGPEAVITIGNEAPEAVTDHPELLAVPTTALAHDYNTIPSETGYFLPDPLLHASTVQDFEPDNMEMGQFFQFSPSATDPLQPHPAAMNPTAVSTATTYEPVAALHHPTDADAAAAAVAQPSPSVCSCGPIPRCICRLKKRVTDLRSENEAFWAERETMRVALVGLRQILESHDELLQVMDEEGVLPVEAMGRLWDCQDRMRAVVMGHR